MTTLKQVTIQNVLTHKKTKINFSPGVNAIIGESDVGKSSILFGIYWLLFNQPRGDDFKSHWAKDKKISVKGVFEDGILLRERSKTFNGYKLAGNRFTGFGSNVPEPIEQFVNMNEVNWLNQMDPPFGLSWSPGEFAKFINRIARLDKIETTTANIGKTIRKEKQQLSNCVQMLSEIGESLKEFREIEQRKKQISKIKKKLKTLQKLKAHRKQLCRSLDEIQSIERERNEIKQRIESAPNFNEIDKTIQQLTKLKKDRDSLHSLCTVLRNLQLDFKSFKLWIKQRESNLAHLMPKKCPLCGNIVRKKHEKNT